MPGHDSDAHRLIRLERERESAGEHAIEVEHQGSVQEDGSRGGDADVVLHGRPRDANDGSTRSSTGSGVEDAHRHLRLAVAVDVHQVIPDGDHLARRRARLGVRGHGIRPKIKSLQRPVEVARPEGSKLGPEFELVRATGLVRREESPRVIFHAVVRRVLGLNHPKRSVGRAPIQTRLLRQARQQHAPHRIDVAKARVQRTIRGAFAAKPRVSTYRRPYEAR